MIYLGVDPGKSGAIVAVHPSGTIQAISNAETERDISDWLVDFINWDELQRVNTCFATIEQVHAMPKNGSVGSFKLGQSFGFLRGLLIAHCIPFEQVSAQKWQKELKCRTGGDKRISKSRAQELAPHFKFTHRTADAFLLAEYGRRTRNA